MRSRVHDWAETSTDTILAGSTVVSNSLRIIHLLEELCRVSCHQPNNESNFTSMMMLHSRGSVLSSTM
jgi:hypothetical protein